MVALAPTQDMPPRGGYAPINFHRIPAKTYFKGWQWFAGFLAIKVAAIYQYSRIKLKVKYEKIENRSARLAIQPLLIAERDRGVLRQLALNREEEEKIMADVPNWEVGKLFNEPIFKTKAANEYVVPDPFEYFVHSDDHTFIDRCYFRWYH